MKNERLTWAEIKARMEAMGVKDNDRIAYIDLSHPPDDDWKLDPCDDDAIAVWN